MSKPSAPAAAPAMSAATLSAALPTALPTGLPNGPFTGRECFQDLIRQALHTAAAQGWQQLWLCDANFADWPLGERAVVDALQHWVSQHRRTQLVLLAADYEELRRRHPLFVQWRVRWDHVLNCRKAAYAERQDIPSVLWSPHWVVQRMDCLRHTGVSGAEPERRVLWRENLSEWLERKSTPGFPASTLGL